MNIYKSSSRFPMKSSARILKSIINETPLYLSIAMIVSILLDTLKLQLHVVINIDVLLITSVKMKKNNILILVQLMSKTFVCVDMYLFSQLLIMCLPI